MDRHREQLRLLAIFHFVYAGLVFLGSLLPLFWLLVASLWWPELTLRVERDPENWPAQLAGTIGLILLVAGLLVVWTWVGALVAAGRSLLRPRRHTFCLVVAAIACLAVPLGTALGVATIVILNQDETRALFAAPAAAG